MPRRGLGEGHKVRCSKFRLQVFKWWVAARQRGEGGRGKDSGWWAGRRHSNVFIAG
jgi:hypothetical protein